MEEKDINYVQVSMRRRRGRVGEGMHTDNSCLRVSQKLLSSFNTLKVARAGTSFAFHILHNTI